MSAPARAAQLGAHPERLEDGRAQVLARTASRPRARRARRAARTRCSSRCAACRAARSASSPSNGSPDACASRWRTVEPSGPAGSSRSTTPSSAATSVASATDRLRDRRPAELRVARPARRRRPRRRAARATATTPRPSPRPARSASTRRDTSRMDRRLISSGSPYEAVARLLARGRRRPRTCTSRAPRR